MTINKSNSVIIEVNVNDQLNLVQSQIKSRGYKKLYIITEALYDPRYNDLILNYCMIGKDGEVNKEHTFDKQLQLNNIYKIWNKFPIIKSLLKLKIIEVCEQLVTQEIGKNELRNKGLYRN